MVINLDFNLSAWIKNLAIEASSEEEAIKKVESMSLAEIIGEGAIVAPEMKLTDIETSVTEYALVVEVSNLVYDLDPEIMDLSVIEYLKNYLPKNLTLTLENVTESDDVKDLIDDALLSELDYSVVSFDYKVIEKK